jgi:phage shock protein C
LHWHKNYSLSEREEYMMDEKTISRLYRSRFHRVFAGVCGGVAEYAKLDVTMVRLLWILAAFFNGIGILAYLVCLILMKENPVNEAPQTPAPPQKIRPELTAGCILITLGAAFLLRNLTGENWWLPWHWHHLLNISVHEIGPIFLIALGIGVLLHSYRLAGSQPGGAATASEKFVRSKNDRLVAGVCGGLASYWRLDATLIRIIWVLMSLAVQPLAGGLLYILMVVLIPENGPQQEPFMPS